MSRYKFFILLLSLFSSLAVQAEVRTLEQARDVAYDFMVSRTQTKSSVIDLQLVYDGMDVATRSSSSSPAYYVFDNAAGPGFVIVSGDDVALPVLGFSDSFNFKTENMPSNLRWWLNTMRSQIEDLRSAGVPTCRSAASVGNEVVRYETALWNQGAPYWDDCPMYKGDYCVTGCGPTAIAIAMRARMWPDKGEGTIPSYTTETEHITVPARKLGTPYDWTNMPLTDDGEKKSWNSTQKAEVARLIADIGAATKADYSLESTGIFGYIVPAALSTYMKYDKSIYEALRDYYSEKEWYPLIKREILNNPVIYSGSDSEGGHMFVLDGYTTSDFFHVNWGWGGAANGYYLLAALNPEEQGYGANELGTYNQYQSAIIGMKKDEGGESLDLIRYYTEGDGYNGLIDREIEFVHNVPYTVNSGYYLNFGNTTYDGRIRIVVVRSDNSVKQTIVEESVELEEGYATYFPELSINIESIEPGDCLIAQYYDNVSAEWKMVRGNTDNGVIESIELDKNTIERTTSLEYCHSTRSFTVRTKDGVSVECSSSDGESVAVMKNSDGTHTISMEGCKVGGYYIDLSDGRESKRIGIKL